MIYMIYRIYGIYKITAFPFVFFWGSWEVFHRALWLILDSVWCTNRSQNLQKSIPGGSKCAQIHPKIDEKAARGLPGDTLWAQGLGVTT
jgi:hypothetical protein